MVFIAATVTLEISCRANKKKILGELAHPHRFVAPGHKSSGVGVAIVRGRITFEVEVIEKSIPLNLVRYPPTVDLSIGGTQPLGVPSWFRLTLNLGG